MMKRSTRTIDVPKLRRNLKNRGRLTETIGFAYIKLVVLWLVCIALDLLLGFRFELLYPVWLLIRNCYDSFRFHGLVSSLQYSAFSMFFVCATATTDLICFIFLPVQLLLLLASTYVWVLFVWQTAERGVGSAQLFLWIALISFEYNWRFRGESPLHLLRGTTAGWLINFITGGLLSSWLGLRESATNAVTTSDHQSMRTCSTVDTVSIISPTGSVLGRFGVALSAAFAHSSFISHLCLPFAAHCIGYPVVTLCFGLKTYMSIWRVKRRQRDVSKENEVYSKLLVEALPSVYEGPKHCSRANGISLHDAENAIDYETEIYAPPISNLAICPSPSSSASNAPRKISRTTSGWKQNGLKPPLNSKRAAHASDATSKERRLSGGMEDDDAVSTTSVLGTSRVTLWRLSYDLIYGVITFLFGGGMGISTSIFDDRISLSSNEIYSDDDVMEQDDTSSQADDLPGSAIGSVVLRSATTKKTKSTNRSRGGRARGRPANNQSDYLSVPCSPVSNVNLTSSSLGASCALNNNILNIAGGSQHEKPLCSASAGSNHNTTIVSNGVIGSCNGSSNKFDVEYASAEDVEALKTELRVARCHETETRCLYQQSLNAEKQAKAELSQMKTKYDQIDSKLSNLLKAREQDRASIQLLEKRLIEAQSRKNELEKERSKVKEEQAAARALVAAQAIKNNECNEACRARRLELERDLRAAKKEISAKEDFISVYEERLKQLQKFKDDNDVQELQVALSSLRDKNSHLEQSLSAENRLKQDLFRVLTETRIQTEMLQNHLRSKDREIADLQARLSSNVADTRSMLNSNNASAHALPALTTSGGMKPALSPNSPTSKLSMNGTCMSKITSSVANEQNMDLLTAALSNAASNYLPYSFGTHSGGNDHLLFDATVSCTQPGANAPASSISPPPTSNSQLQVDSHRYISNQFGAPSVPKTTTSRSS